MQRVVQILTVIVAFFAFTHRLPAPIQETDPSPTPVQKVKQRSNNVNKTEAKPSTPAPKPRALLAGTWAGVVHTFPAGDQSATFVISPDETTFTVNWFGKTGTVATQRVGTSTLTATFPQRSQPQSQVWTVTPQPDGLTALVHFQAFLNDSSTTFRRTAH